MCKNCHPESNWFAEWGMETTRLHAFMIVNALIAFTCEDDETVKECYRDVEMVAREMDVEWRGSLVDMAKAIAAELLSEKETPEVKPEQCVGKPIGCGREIPGDEFVKWDELSRREFKLSRLCIHCQGTVFDHVGTINGIGV